MCAFLSASSYTDMEAAGFFSMITGIYIRENAVQFFILCPQMISHSRFVCTENTIRTPVFKIKVFVKHNNTLNNVVRKKKLIINTRITFWKVYKNFNVLWHSYYLLSGKGYTWEYQLLVLMIDHLPSTNSFDLVQFLGHISLTHFICCAMPMHSIKKTTLFYVYLIINIHIHIKKKIVM